MLLGPMPQCAEMKKILLAIVFVVCFSGVGHTESWVLWELFTRDNSGWEIVDAFPSYEGCKDAQLKECKKLVFSNIDLCPNEIEFKDGGAILFRCFPDTVDPRK
jgi:hypothetical protein